MQVSTYHPRKSDQGTRGRCDKYTSLDISREKIYQEYANTEFRKVEIRNLFPVRESSKIDMTKYSRFRKGDRRDRENSPNNKFPSKTMDIGADGEGTSKENKGEENKGKTNILRPSLREYPGRTSSQKGQ